MIYNYQLTARGPRRDESRLWLNLVGFVGKSVNGSLNVPMSKHAAPSHVKCLVLDVDMVHY